MSAAGLDRIALALTLAAAARDEAGFVRHAQEARQLGASAAQVRRAWRNYRIARTYRPRAVAR